MKFIDETIIKVKAGDGGSGMKSWRREKFVPLGGPDGGDGGNGGSVSFIADRNMSTLLDFTFHPSWEGDDGEKGGTCNCHGKNGKDLLVKVPVGTTIYRLTSENRPNGEKNLIVDLCKEGQIAVIAKGGRGGKGNTFFKSPTNRAPEHFQPGEPGEAGAFLLSLKLVAEVGLIGLPNAGKSTLISRISAAKPKIADYPFTTLVPNLGVAQAKGNRSFVVADIPGLIPGAHEGKGLGIKFLKHIERTRVLAHLVDPLAINELGEPVAIEDALAQINNELAMFSPELSEKEQVLVITKLDSVTDRTAIESTLSTFRAMGKKALAISSASGEGIPELVNLLADMAGAARASESDETEDSGSDID